MISSAEELVLKNRRCVLDMEDNEKRKNDLHKIKELNMVDSDYVKLDEKTKLPDECPNYGSGYYKPIDLTASDEIAVLSNLVNIFEKQLSTDAQTRLATYLVDRYGV